MTEPKLRFKDENEEKYPKWKKVSFRETCDGFDYGMNAAAVEFDGHNKYIRITDIDDNSHKYSYEKVSSPSGALDDKYLVRKRDILLARTGASVGKSYLYTPEDGVLYYAGFLIRMHVKDKYVPEFIFAQTLSDKYKRWVKLTSTRSGQPGINSTEYMTYTFECPCREEQQKIANLLSCTDEVIATLTKEVRLWEEKKQGVMQKIFSQKVRFKDENGEDYPEWQTSKLGELGSFDKGKVLSKADIAESGIPMILYGELYTSYSEVAYKIQRKTEHEIDGLYLSKGGEVILPCSGETPEDISTATCVMVSGVALGGDLIIFTPYKIDGRIISYILNHQQKYKIASVAQGKSIVHISANSIKKLDISYPVSVKEQQKIADCLSSIDEVIAIKKQKLETWKNIKKGLLQQMFV